MRNPGWFYCRREKLIGRSVARSYEKYLLFLQHSQEIAGRMLYCAGGMFKSFISLHGWHEMDANKVYTNKF